MDSWKTPDRLQSFSGIIIILFLGFFFSKYPGKVSNVNNEQLKFIMILKYND